MAKIAMHMTCEVRLETFYVQGYLSIKCQDIQIGDFVYQTNPLTQVFKIAVLNWHTWPSM